MNKTEIGNGIGLMFDPDSMIIDHTFVDPAFRGQKLAENWLLQGEK